MARIPRFQQRALASSLVGVPRLDLSEAQTIGVIGEAVSGAAESLGQLGQQGLILLEKRKQASQTAEANRHIIDFEIGAEQDFVSHKQTFQLDPVNKTMEYRDVLTERLETLMESIESDAVRQTVSNSAQPLMRQKILKEFSWSQGQQVQVAFNDMNSSIMALSTDARNVGASDEINKLQRYLELQDSIPGVLVTGSTILSSKQQQELGEKAPKELASGFLYGLMDTHPEEALLFLDTGLFDSVLTPKERAEFQSDSTKRLKKINEVIKFQNLVSEIDSNKTLWDKFKDGSLTLDEIDRLDPSTFRDTLRDMVLEDSPISEKANAVEYVTLLAEYTQLQSNSDRKKKKASGQLEDILRFQNKVIDAKKREMITTEQAKTFNTLAIPLANKIREETGTRGRLGALSPNMFGATRSPMKEGFKILNDWLVSENLEDDVRIKMEIFDEFVSRVDEIGEVDSDKNLKKTVRSISQDIIRKRRFEDSPFSHLDIGDMWETPVGPRKIKSFNTKTGTPQIELSDQDILDLRERGINTNARR